MTDRDDALRVLFVTAPPDVAADLGRRLVEERLVACANVLPGARSFYWWEGKVCDDAEAVLWMETTARRLADAAARLRELHPYSVPKIVAFDPWFVGKDYLAWARTETDPAAPTSA